MHGSPTGEPFFDWRTMLMRFSHAIHCWLPALVIALCAPAAFGQPDDFFNAPGSGKKGEVPPKDRLKVSAVFDPAEAQRGGTVTLKVTLAPASGYHSYPTKQADPKADSFVTTIEFPDLKDLKPAKDWKEPKPKIVDEKDLKIKIGIYEERAVLENTMGVPKDAAPGAKKIKVAINTQVCDEKGCIPVGENLEVPLTISSKPPVDAAPGNGSGSTTSGTSASPQPSANGEPDRSGLMGFILEGVVFGFLSLLTPCVFPMIPITVSFFLKQSERENHKPLTMASVYSGTIVITLAIGAIVFLAAAQDLIQDWPANLWIGILFVAFALSLYGLFEMTVATTLKIAYWNSLAVCSLYFLTLPDFSWSANGRTLIIAAIVFAVLGFLLRFVDRFTNTVQQTTASQGDRGGIIGTVFMALTFTLVSFSCVAPFLGGFAGIAVKSRPFYEIVAGALAFSVTFAAPFFVLALFPTWLKSMPKSGAWMNSVKVVMGFLELAAALKFLRASELLGRGEANLLTYDFVLGMYVAIALMCGLYLLNLYRLPHDDTSNEPVGVVRLMFGFVFLSLAFYLMPGLFKYNAVDKVRPSGSVFNWLDSFLLPDPVASAGGTSGQASQDKSSDTGGHFAWIPNYHQGFEVAWNHRKNQEPKSLVFIDFTGLS
jgi:thiol:disulfide interchange protein